jgi:hypothetical protein
MSPAFRLYETAATWVEQVTADRANLADHEIRARDRDNGSNRR